MLWVRMYEPNFGMLTIMLLAWAIVQVYPILFMVFTSVKADKQILNAPFALPDPLLLDNYATVWGGDRVSQPFSTFFINSFVITLGSLAILLFCRRARRLCAGARAFPRQRGDAAGLSAHAGGALLALGCSSLWDENGGQRPDFGLADVFGVEYEREAGCEFVYLRLADDALRKDVTAPPILIDETPLRVALHGAQVLGDFLGPESGRSEATTILWGDAGPDEEKRFPGIVRHHYGAGKCVYVATVILKTSQQISWQRIFGFLASDEVFSGDPPRLGNSSCCMASRRNKARPGP